MCAVELVAVIEEDYFERPAEVAETATGASAHVSPAEIPRLSLPLPNPELELAPVPQWDSDATPYQSSVTSGEVTPSHFEEESAPRHSHSIGLELADMHSDYDSPMALGERVEVLFDASRDTETIVPPTDVTNSCIRSHVSEAPGIAEGGGSPAEAHVEAHKIHPDSGPEPLANLDDPHQAEVCADDIGMATLSEKPEASPILRHEPDEMYRAVADASLAEHDGDVRASDSSPLGASQGTAFASARSAVQAAAAFDEDRPDHPKHPTEETDQPDEASPLWQALVAAASNGEHANNAVVGSGACTQMDNTQSHMDVTVQPTVLWRALEEAVVYASEQS